jgi:hypothetical protein
MEAGSGKAHRELHKGNGGEGILEIDIEQV